MTIDRLLPGLALASLLWIPACGKTPKPQPPPSDDLLIEIPSGAPTNASSCEARLDFAQRTMGELTRAANGTCDSNADCELVFAETQCQGACQAPILASRMTAFRRSQEAINERVCTNYVEDGCPFSTPACLAVEAVCESNRCALVPLRE